jgi:hypothetical protein
MTLRRGVRWAALAIGAAALFGAVIEPAPAVPAAGRSDREAMRTWTTRAPGTPTSSWAARPSGRITLTSFGHILIPAAGVDAPLVPLGLRPDGSLDVPDDARVVGWFAGGPFPGQPGPAVVVGHVDSTRVAAVFYHLGELRPGDLIVVWRLGGARSRFVVTSVERLPKSSFPTDRVYRSVRRPALRLITCGGAFDEATGHYVDNVIVFAVPA